MVGRETKLIQTVRASARRHALANASVVVGFSGGRDSTVLLASLRPVVRQLRAVHVDHGVRAESAADAERALAIAGELGLPCEVVRLDGDRIAAHRGVGLEEALRRERYRALAAFAGDVIATGHHAVDQAETVLGHLLRGSGLRGVSGMREISTLAVPWWEASAVELRIWRPLLSVQPEVLDEELGRLEIVPIVDVSNADRAFRRNALRHDVLPLLESIQPGATAALVRFADLAGVDDNMLDHLASESLEGTIDLPVRLVQQLDPALQRRVVRLWMLSAATTHLEISYERGLAVLEAVLQNRGGAAIEVAERCVVVIDDGVARFVEDVGSGRSTVQS